MISIALLGYGVVGSGVVELINKNKKENFAKYEKEISITHILVRNKDKYKHDEHFDIITNDFEDIYNSNVDIVVEVMGGLSPSLGYVKRLLEKNVHVITANKDLIAEHGDTLHQLAFNNSVQLRYEASVGGGIPIIGPVIESLTGNKINSVFGILNGTTNFILSKMYAEGMSYGEALEIAQDLGFAEANPDSDVLGLDASRKLSIISSLAYEKNIDWKSIATEGITNITSEDIHTAKLMDAKLKLIAMSTEKSNKVYAAVRPTLVSKNSSFSNIDNEFNGVVINGDAVGEVMFTGKGAGKLPTASAVYGDVINIITNRKNPHAFLIKPVESAIASWPYKSKWALRIHSDVSDNLLNTIFTEFSDSSVEVLNTQSQDLLAIVETENECIIQKKVEKLNEITGINVVNCIMLLDEDLYQ